MTAAYLAPLTRPELDELIRHAEHASGKSHVVFANAPLLPYEPGRIAALAGVAGDCMALCVDAYDASMLLSAAEMDRVFNLPAGEDA